MKAVWQDGDLVGFEDGSVFEVVWHGAKVCHGVKGGLLNPYGYHGGSTWRLLEEYLWRAHGRIDVEGVREKVRQDVRNRAHSSGGGRIRKAVERA
jgi:hypothetical protein